MFKTLLACAVVSALLMACSTAAPPKSAEIGPGAPKVAAATRPCAQATTASRIAPRPGDCPATPGQTYSNEDIQRTGQTDVGNALQMLDPSISVHH